MKLLRTSAPVLAGVMLLGCALRTEGLPSEGSGAAQGTGPSGAGAGSADSSSSGATGTGGSAACAPGSKCVAVALAGAYVRVASAAATTCPPGWTDASAYGDGNDPGCTPCACAPPTGTCAPGAVFASDQDCSQLFGPIGLPVGVCVDFTQTAKAALLAPSAPSAGSCAAGQSMPEALAVSTLCAPESDPGAACGDGLVCVPDGDPAFDRLCNLLPEGAECSPGWTPAGPVASVLADDRMCSCSCGAPAGQVCTGATLVYWGNDGCAGAPLSSVAGNGACQPTIPTNGSVVLDVGVWAAGTCAASQSGSGQVSFGPKQTLCCLE